MADLNTGILNPNIILGSTNPMDNMSKIAQFQGLQLQNQQARQQFQDQQNLRNAYVQNTSVDANGNPSIDRQGIMKNLAQTSPSLVSQVAAGFRQQDEANLNAQFEKLGKLSQLVGGAQDQDSWTRGLQEAQSVGLDTSQIPKQFDPKVASNIQGMVLTSQQQIADRAEQQGLTIKQQEANTAQLKAENESKQFTYGKQQDALHNTMESINASRQQTADVNQAYSDRYNAQKVKDIVASKNNPNQVDVNMVPVVAAEVAKIAQGGAPQHEELEQITPKDANMILSKTKQYLTSNPSAGQQGAFLKAYQDYANMIQSHANDVIQNSVGKKIENMKGRLAPEDYQSLKSSYVDNPYGPDNQGKTNPVPSAWSGSHKDAPIGTVSLGQVKTQNGWVPVNASK